MKRRISLLVYRKRVLSIFLCLILMIGTMTQYNLPVQSANSTSIDPMISIGKGFTVALSSDGTAWSWGKNNVGQLGAGISSNTAQTTPVQVSTEQTFSAVAAGESHVVALATDGSVWTWGENGVGQLGIESNVDQTAPVKVKNLDNVKVIAVAAGSNTSYALTEDEKVYAWGSNQNGALGIYEKEEYVQSVDAPELVATLSNVRKIFAGEDTAAAITSDGKVWIWGDNTSKQVGLDDGTAAYYLPQCKEPTVEGELSYQASAVAIGAEHTSILTPSGTILNFGIQSKGQFGNNAVKTTSSVLLAKKYCTTVSSIPQVLSVAAGSKHMIALTEGGKIYAWGDNSDGQLANNTASLLLPTEISLENYTNGTVTYIAAGYNTTAVIDSEGHVFMWGYGSTGQLGNGSASEQQYEPTAVLSADGSGSLYLGLPSEDIVQDVYVTATATIPSPTFQISVPATLDFGTLEQKSDTAENRIAKVDFSVSAGNIRYLFGEKIVVKVAPSTGNAFVLTGSNSTLPYAVYSDAVGDEALNKDAQFAVFEQAGGTVNGRIEIDQSDIVVADDYGGTLNFYVSVTDTSDS